MRDQALSTVIMQKQRDYTANSVWLVHGGSDVINRRCTPGAHLDEHPALKKRTEEKAMGAGAGLR